MNESNLKKAMKEQLEEWEFQVEELLPSPSQKTPDLKFWDENNKYLLELKTKEDDPKELGKEQELLKKQKIVHRSVPAGRRNTLYGLISDGVEQLKEYDSKNECLHLLWLQSTGRDAELLFRRFHASLFGAQDFISVKRKNLMTCYFFHDSAFYTNRHALDGAIIGKGSEMRFCVNSYSKRVDILRASKLYQQFGKGVCDPITESGNQDVLIADCDMDRKDSQAIVNYLKKKYNLDHLQTIDLAQHSGTMVLPSD